MNIGELLLLTKEKEASDLHLNVGISPTLRIHGDVIRTSKPPLTRKDAKELIYSILSDRQRALFEEKKDIDFSIEVEGISRFRVNVYMERRGIAAVFRCIQVDPPSMADLNLPDSISALLELEKGLILVTGPTGSGKSSTLAAMLRQVNETKRGHIITLEEPIEFVHQPQNCIVSQREVYVHSESYSTALRAALREDPDYILIGEMRDLETIQMAIRAAETGHMVFSTLHTMSAAKTIDRVIDVFPAEQQSQIRIQLAESIQGIVSQTLVKKIAGDGRVAAIEMLVATSGVRNLIREGKTEQLISVLQTGARDNMQSMDQSLAKLVQQNIVGRQEAMKHALDTKTLLNLLGGV